MNSGTHLYPESTTLITEIEATGVQLKPENIHRVVYSFKAANISQFTVIFLCQHIIQLVSLYFFNF